MVVCRRIDEERKRGFAVVFNLEREQGCDHERKEWKEAMVDHCRGSCDLGFLPFF